MAPSFETVSFGLPFIKGLLSDPRNATSAVLQAGVERSATSSNDDRPDSLLASFSFRSILGEKVYSFPRIEDVNTEHPFSPTIELRVRPYLCFESAC